MLDTTCRHYKELVMLSIAKHLTVYCGTMSVRSFACAQDDKQNGNMSIGV